MRKSTAIKFSVQLLLFFCWTCSASAQDTSKSIPQQDTTAKVPAHKKREGIKPLLSFDSRYSIIDNHIVRIFGFKGGIEFYSKFRIYLGYYALSSQIDDLIKVRGQADSQSASFHLNYFALSGEYVFLRKKRWEVSLPVQFGLGTVYYSLLNSPPETRERRRSPFTMVEPSIAAQYKIYPWLGIGGGAGYRQVIGVKTRIEHNLDAPIFFLKARIFIGPFFRIASHIIGGNKFSAGESGPPVKQAQP